MSISTLTILIFIGISAGVLAGFVGVGGGIIIVPALVYALGMTQHGAQGTSLALMLPPIGILAFMNYYRAGEVNLTYAAIIAFTFIIGGYFGAKISLKLPSEWVKLIFGGVMMIGAIKMICSAVSVIFNNS